MVFDLGLRMGTMLTVYVILPTKKPTKLCGYDRQQIAVVDALQQYQGERGETMEDVVYISDNAVRTPG